MRDLLMAADVVRPRRVEIGIGSTVRHRACSSHTGG